LKEKKMDGEDEKIEFAGIRIGVSVSADFSASRNSATAAG
jgi:hypothetical protein